MSTLVFGADRPAQEAVSSVSPSSQRRPLLCKLLPMWLSRSNDCARALPRRLTAAPRLTRQCRIRAVHAARDWRPASAAALAEGGGRGALQLPDRRARRRRPDRPVAAGDVDGLRRRLVGARGRAARGLRRARGGDGRGRHRHQSPLAHRARRAGDCRRGTGRGRGARDQRLPRRAGDCQVPVSLCRPRQRSPARPGRRGQGTRARGDAASASRA